MMSRDTDRPHVDTLSRRVITGRTQPPPEAVIVLTVTSQLRTA